METANPILSIKERVENLIFPRVTEVLISKVIALLTQAWMIYLSKAAQYLKTWNAVVGRSNLFIKMYLEIFAMEKKRDYILSS